MGGAREDGRALVGRDGRRYYLVPFAATLLGVSPDTVRREFSLVLARDLVDLPKTSGRPHTHVVIADEVDRRRRELLVKLGVLDGTAPVATADTAELKDLRRRVRELNSQYDDLREQYELLVATSSAQSAELSRLHRYYVDQIRSTARGGIE